MSTTFYDILCIDRYVDMCGYYIISSFKGCRVVRKRKSVSEVYGECSSVRVLRPYELRRTCGWRTAVRRKDGINTALLWLLQ